MKNYTEQTAIWKIFQNAKAKQKMPKVIEIEAGSCGLRIFGACDYLKNKYRYHIIWKHS